MPKDERQVFLWLVRLGERQCSVMAADKLEASKKAARAMGAVWRETARDMEFTRLRRVKGDAEDG